MDSLTQAVLGATVGAVCVRKEDRRKAALIGAALGTLPDLDVMLDYGNAVANFTLHRGFSHSLFVLVPFAAVLWRLLKQFYGPVRDNPKPWFWAIMLPLVTHVLLDAQTAYGTQIFWPLDVHPTKWANLFIIDPTYTLPLLIATLAVLIKPQAGLSQKLLRGGLVLSCIYLSWTWIAKYQVTQKAYAETQFSGANIQVFTTPTPFNSVMWRIVVKQGDQYQEGYYHFLFPQKIQFNTYSTNPGLFADAEGLADIKQLDWFAEGLIRADEVDKQLVISDLRMGFEDNYAFRHVVARKADEQWQPVLSVRLESGLNRVDLGEFWEVLTNFENNGQL